MVIFREPALKRVKFCAIVEMCIVFDAIPWWHDTPGLSVDVVLNTLLSKVKLNAFLQLVVCEPPSVGEPVDSLPLKDQAYGENEHWHIEVVLIFEAIILVDT